MHFAAFMHVAHKPRSLHVSDKVSMESEAIEDLVECFKNGVC